MQSLLSNKMIRHHWEEGTIIISPFHSSNLGTCSYDVTLGEFYYRETPPGMIPNQNIYNPNIYNPYSEREVHAVWGSPQTASPIPGHKFKGIAPDDLIILLKPNETILAHTNEFIGGRKTVTSMMKARSSFGRNFIEVCKCAGWGDIGYINRWTMEITNNSRHYTIPLVVGRRIAQIVFFNTDGITEEDYTQNGKYQTTPLVGRMMQEWNPSCMLPRLFADREVLGI